jgi:hypothetical protein
VVRSERLQEFDQRAVDRIRVGQVGRVRLAHPPGGRLGRLTLSDTVAAPGFQTGDTPDPVEKASALREGE